MGKKSKILQVFLSTEDGKLSERWRRIAVMDDRKKEVEKFELFIAIKRGLSDLEEAHSMVNIIIFSSYFYR